MKKGIGCLIVLLCVALFLYCTRPAEHADPFYNVSEDFEMIHIPLIKPIQIVQGEPYAPWRIFLGKLGIWVSVPNSKEAYVYNIEEVEKFDLQNGIIMVYSPYVNKKANPYILNNFYHWFVLFPDKNISEGFHTEVEFIQYIKTLDIEKLGWKTPDEVYEQFRHTGCLEWIPDCK